MLNMPRNAIHVSARRLGGAYGGKINRPPMVASIAALAASKLDMRVKLMLSLSDNMKICGKRPEYSFSYSVYNLPTSINTINFTPINPKILSYYSKAALDNNNKVDSMAIDLVADSGYTDYTEGATTSNLINGYTLYSSNNGITATSQDVRGNVPKGTFVRSPGWVQVLIMIGRKLIEYGIEQ